jgi:hypothetical protein
MQSLQASFLIGFLFSFLEHNLERIQSRSHYALRNYRVSIYDLLGSILGVCAKYSESHRIFVGRQRAPNDNDPAFRVETL